jgi:hypothetical protein
MNEEKFSILEHWAFFGVKIREFLLISEYGTHDVTTELTREAKNKFR